MPGAAGRDLRVSSASSSATGRPARAARLASTSRRRRVSVAPGATQFTVTPSAAYSRDSSFAAAVTAARSTTEMARSGWGWRTAVEVTNTSRPKPRDAMPGSASRASRSGPSSSSSVPARHASSATSRIPPGGGPPALSDQTSGGP